MKSDAKAELVASLPSWNDGPRRAAIVDFIGAATDPQSLGYIRPEDRIACFDNDGTLWAEKPYPVQAYFTLDRAAERAAVDPDWASAPALKAAAEKDFAALLVHGVPGLKEVLGAVVDGIPVDDFIADARLWLATARNPAIDMRFRDMIYRPMCELIAALEANGFKCFVISAGGVDFMRAFASDAYGLPLERIIGSEQEAHYTIVDGKPQVVKGNVVALVDDKQAKPPTIQRSIGRRPVFVAGNSDGDFEMAEWATSAAGPTLAIFIHHTDAVREFAYDREGIVGVFNRAQDAAPKRDWQIVDMATDWNQIF